MLQRIRALSKAVPMFLIVNGFVGYNCVSPQAQTRFKLDDEIQAVRRTAEDAERPGTPYKGKLDLVKNGNPKHVISQGGVFQVDRDSKWESGTEILVTHGILLIKDDIKGRSGRGKGKIRLMPDEGKKALMVIDGNCDIDADEIEISKGADLLIRNPKKLKVRSIKNRGRIVFETSSTPDWEGTLSNDGQIFLANPNQSEAADPPVVDFTIVNNGVIESAVAELPDPDGSLTPINIGVLYGNIESGPSGIVKLRAPQANPMLTPFGKVEKRSPQPTTGAYLTVNGSLGSTSGVLDVDVDSAYYGQYSSSFPVSISGAQLLVNTYSYNPPPAEKLYIVKATNVTGSGFGTSTYNSGYAYSHTISTLDTCATNRRCYFLTNTLPLGR